jgi:hypothetical protein
MKMNSAAAGSSDVGGDHNESFLGKDLGSGLAILGSDGRPTNARLADGQDVGASEDLHLQLTARGSESIELAGQETNAEVYVTMALAGRRLRRKAGRTVGKHAMTESPGSEPRAPERDTDAGPQDSPQDSWFAGEEQLAGLEIEVGENVIARHHETFL